MFLKGLDKCLCNQITFFENIYYYFLLHYHNIKNEEITKILNKSHKISKQNYNKTENKLFKNGFFLQMQKTKIVNLFERLCFVESYLSVARKLVYIGQHFLQLSFEQKISRNLVNTHKKQIYGSTLRCCQFNSQLYALSTHTYVYGLIS